MSTIQMEIVPIGDRKVQVQELTIGQIKVLWRELQTFDVGKLQVAGFTQGIEDVWNATIKGLGIDELDEFHPSEMKLIADAFERVNDVFFGLAKSVEGENPLLHSLRTALITDLMNRFAGLYAPATLAVPTESGATDTNSSLPPSTS